MREDFGPDAAARRLALLRSCARLRCKTPAQLSSLHETLCFSRAYPDNAEVLGLVDGLLDGWGRRGDVRTFGDTLQGHGMAGVSNRFAFYWPTAHWLAQHWPQSLHVDWGALQDDSRIHGLLKLLMPRAESPGLEELPLSVEQWITHLKKGEESDGTFLVRRFAEAEMDERWREHLFDSLDLPFTLTPGEASPSRTRARIEGLPLHFQISARSSTRPALDEELSRAPRRIRHVSKIRGEEFVDTAREAMLTRSRDLEQIAYANPGDAWLIEDGDGLSFVALGMLPDRRFVLEATYVYLMVQNGVPIGYMQGSGLGGWAEINFNIFPPWRGRGAALLYARSLAAIHSLQRVTTFIVDPYQLGDGNEEAIETGAWWFYFKLGFRPLGDTATLELAMREEERAHRRSGYRSSSATLRRLAEQPMIFSAGEAPRFPYGGVGLVGLHASARLSEHGGGYRRDALERASDEAAQLLDRRRDVRRELSSRERAAFAEWSAIIVSMPGVPRWGASKRRALLDVVRARGAKTERDYIEALHKAPHVLDALAKLADHPRPARLRVWDR